MVFDFPLQQRGERDSQTQAILTKLKCAAGELWGGRTPPLTSAPWVARACRVLSLTTWVRASDTYGAR